MQRSRKHFNSKNIFLVGLVVCLLTLFFINQKASTKAQTVETKRDKPELVVQTGHRDVIHSVAFSPDGKIVASGSGDKTIKLWTVVTGQEIKSLTGHTKWVTSVAFSPDGKTLASGSDDNTIKLWNVETGQEIKSLKGHPSMVRSVTFSPDGKTLASGCDHGIKLWNVETRKEIKSFNGYPSWGRTITFSSDGKTLASGSRDDTIKIWNIETEKEIKSLTGHTNLVYSLDYSPDRKTLASGSCLTVDESNECVKGEIKIWNIETGKEIKSLKGHTNRVNSVAFSPDGKTLVSGSWDKTIKLWNLETEQEIKSLEGHTAYVNSVAFSPDGKTFASGSSDKTIKLWNETGKEIKSFNGHTEDVDLVVFSSEGKTLASGSKDGTIKLWNVETGQEIKSLIGHTYGVNSGAFLQGGKTFASGSSNGKIKLWNIETGKEIKSFNVPSGSFYSVAYSPDGKTLASGSSNGKIKLWNIETGKEIKSFNVPTNWVRSVAFSPDGKTLASGGNAIKLWNVETGEEIKSMTSYFPYPVAFSPDGKTLASIYINTIKLWNVETGQEIKSLKGHPSMVRSVTFSPNGKTLASGSDDKTIKLWNVETGKEIKSFNGHTNWVRSVAYSPDGKVLASGSWDATMILWHVETGKNLATLISLDKERWVVTTPDGRFDTNLDLNKIEGLIWVLPDQPLTPKPLELYMRQYYEPGLLARVLRCTEENNCDTEFKPLPSIAEINRVQPRVEIKEIKPKANNADLVDVVVEVESRTEEIGRKPITSGVFDLRLFRDGQLVATSAKVADLEKYIRLAPQAVEKDRAAKTLLNTEEDKAWRNANDLARFAKFDKNKATFVFENVRLPRDGRKSVEFTAYAFNEDRVRSNNAVKQFQLPDIAALKARKQRAFLISIGVNASENPAYNLRYAANDARKMQEIIGTRLKAESEKYSEVVQIPLISDYASDKNPAENNAQKAIIKGVFSLLAGNEKEIPADILKLIPNREQIKAVEPEDTLIITYAGHGYADNAGIFYLLPSDIGKDTRQLTIENLRKMISSDELSLWMQHITSAEMIMIIDACHSSAAVQGDGFKPGPMASRGLGQLAYDKDMKILSATQANNVALELGSLQQGLLSYALLQDGIVLSLADADKNKQLLSTEWLSFAEKRVPELYAEIKDGKRSVFINSEQVKDGKSRSEIIDLDGKQKSNLNLQQPTVFDFKRRKTVNNLFNLP